MKCLKLLKQVEIGEKTVIQMMYQYLCDVCTTKLLNTPIQLGSQDVVKAKYRFKEMKSVSKSDDNINIVLL
jgi:hypothetical protein